MTGKRVLFREQSLSDAYEQAAAQNWLPVEINQISTGQYAGRICVLEHAHVSAYLENQNCTVHKRGVMDRASCTVSLFRNRSSQVRFSEYAPTEKALFFLPGGAEFDIHVSANVETAYFRFDQSALLEKARAMNPCRWEKVPLSLQSLELLDRQPLDAFIEQLFSGALSAVPDHNGHDSLARTVLDQVLLALNGDCCNDTGVSAEVLTRRRATALVNRVIDYVSAELDQGNCPGISDICYDVQVSERTLQYCFRNVLALSPGVYLRYLRLNRARAALVRPADGNVTVTRVATQWHFLHLGRFSRDYLNIFDELPSTTLHRALS